MSRPVIYIVGKPIEAALPGFLRRGGPATREFGGYATYVRAHLRAAIRAGYEPHTFVAGRRPSVTESDLGFMHTVRVPAVPPRQNLIPLIGPPARRVIVDFALRSQQRALIHAFQVWGHVGVEAARALERRRQRPVTITSFFTTYEHESVAKWLEAGRAGPLVKLGNWAELVWARAVVNRLEAAAYRRSNVVVANYASVQRLLASTYGPRPMEKIGYAPETAFYVGDAHAPVPAELAVLDNPNAPLIVTASRHDPRKGLPVLIEALTLLRNRGVDFRACLLGGGPLLALHRKMVRQAGLGDSVAVTGHIADPADYLRNADIFVLPSFEEGSGSMSLLEAMQFGLAPVVSAIDGLVEDIVDGVDGLLVRPGDTHGLANALGCIIRNTGFRRELAEAARQTYDSRFSADRLVSDLGALYEHALAPR